jgi:hypothetical protein
MMPGGILQDGQDPEHRGEERQSHQDHPDRPAAPAGALKEHEGGHSPGGRHQEAEGHEMEVVGRTPLEAFVPGRAQPEQQPQGCAREQPPQAVQEDTPGDPGLAVEGPPQHSQDRENGRGHRESADLDQPGLTDGEMVAPFPGQEHAQRDHAQHGPAEEEPAPALPRPDGSPVQHGQDGHRMSSDHREADDLDTLRVAGSEEPSQGDEVGEGSRHHERKSLGGENHKFGHRGSDEGSGRGFGPFSSQEIINIRIKEYLHKIIMSMNYTNPRSRQIRVP